MRILFVCQYFYPENFRGNDIAFKWASEGHSVHVLTGIPNYPTGKFYPGHGWFRKRHEVINGVKVTRLPIVARGENSKLKLVLNYFSYQIVACIYILFHAIGHKYDRVFCQQLSPVMMSSPAVLYKKLRKTPLYTWVLDLWPESLAVAGGISNKYVLGFFKHFVSREYKYSDVILTSSRSFDKSILEYGQYKDKIIYFPQWADGDSTTRPTECSVAIPDLPEGFRIMFAGAVGEAHGMECNMQAAMLTKEHKEIKWVIVGDGRRLPWVKEYVRENCLEDTVLILGRYPSEAMPLLFSQADVMLVSLNDSALFNLYAPAKISSYMASSKPIIAVLNGEGADVVKDAGCGWCVKAGDSESLAKLAIEISHMGRDILSEKGRAAKAYYDEHFDKETCLAELNRIMKLN